MKSKYSLKLYCCFLEPSLSYLEESEKFSSGQFFPKGGNQSSTFYGYQNVKSGRGKKGF
jgi:hypothetical protein